MANPTKLTSKKLLAVLVCALLSLCFISTALAQSSTSVNAQASTTQPQVGSTLTVNVKISNVQNLFSIDTTLQWNSSVLTLTTTVLNLGDSHSNGVLHGNNLNTDANNLNSGDIYVQETKVAGSYELVATSVGATTSSFSGSGTIATLTFNVVNPGSAGLSLSTDLSDKAVSGSTANLIDHQDTVDTVNAVAAGSSSSPSSSPSVPELPAIMVMAILISFAISASVLAIKRIKKTKIASAKI